MIIEIGDIDIDVTNREDVLENIKHIPVIRLDKDKITKHNTGIYVQDIEMNPTTGWAKNLENDAIKIDVLNFSPLRNFLSNDQVDKLSNLEPDWKLLTNKSFVEKTTQIHNWFDFIKSTNIDSVDKLAMTLALIRPGKEYLKNRSWEDIEKNIWIKEGKYNFKKSHAYSYALTIVALMNLESGK